MIDRPARDRMAKLIESFMAGRLGSTRFDKVLWEIKDASGDKTIEHVALAIAGHYDNMEDHRIRATQVEWDHFNRLLLLLKSDSEIEIPDKTIRFTLPNLLAAVSLACFIFLAIKSGFGFHLMILVLPFGLISFLLLDLKEIQDGFTREQLTLRPFPSISSLLAVRRRTLGFSRIRFPKKLKRNLCYSPLYFFQERMRLTWFMLLLSPLTLLFLALPDRQEGLWVKAENKS